LRKLFAKANKKAIHTFVIASAIICTLLVPSIVGAATLVTMTGSTTVYPIADATRTAGGWTDMDITGGGSGNGINQILADTCDIGMSSSTLDAKGVSQSDQDKLDVWVVAADMICVVVNADFYDVLDPLDGSDDDVVNITLSQIEDIYEAGSSISGMTWNDIDSDWPATPIAPAARVTASGTRSMFHKFCDIDDDDEVDTIDEIHSEYGYDRMPGNQDMTDLIAGNSSYWNPSSDPEQPVGYIGLGYAVNEPDVRALYVEGVKPIAANSGSYDLSRQLFYFTRKAEFETAESWNMRALDFVEYQLSPSGQSRVTAEGYIAVPRSLNPAPYWDIVLDSRKRVDVADASYFGSHWNETGSCGWCRADLNNNGRVDVPDASKLGSVWNDSWDY
jgi:phosphate transport system substrate-binding protein